MGWGSGRVMEDRGRDTGDGWALSERCIHQTRAGFHFCVKSCYQTGAGYAGWEKEAEGGGAEKKNRKNVVDTVCVCILASKNNIH